MTQILEWTLLKVLFSPILSLAQVWVALKKWTFVPQVPWVRKIVLLRETCRTGRVLKLPPPMATLACFNAITLTGNSSPPLKTSLASTTR